MGAIALSSNVAKRKTKGRTHNSHFNRPHTSVAQHINAIIYSGISDKLSGLFQRCLTFLKISLFWLMLNTLFLKRFRHQKKIETKNVDQFSKPSKCD